MRTFTTSSTRRAIPLWIWYAFVWGTAGPWWKTTCFWSLPFKFLYVNDPFPYPFPSPPPPPSPQPPIKNSIFCSTFRVAPKREVLPCLIMKLTENDGFVTSSRPTHCVEEHEKETSPTIFVCLHKSRRSVRIIVSVAKKSNESIGRTVTLNARIRPTHNILVKHPLLNLSRNALCYLVQVFVQGSFYCSVCLFSC